MGDGPETPGATASEKAAGKVHVEQWNEYATNFHEPIMRWSKSIAKDKTPEMDQATGITNADLAQQTAGVEKRLASGMNPNSGKGFGALQTVASVEGEAGSGAAVKTRQGVEDKQLADFGEVANVGMGQKAVATRGINDIAASSVDEAIGDSLRKQGRRNDNVNFITGMGGVAAGVATAGGGGMKYDKVGGYEVNPYRANATDPLGIANTGRGL